MTPLKIRLLGNPEITVGQQSLSFRTRKVLALLIYLVVEGGLHSRESLMALLWPESPSGNAAVTLRATLSRLRKSMRPSGGSLVSQAGKVGFNFDGSYELDISWLAKAILPKTPPDDLRAILDLDRGEFLAGFNLPDAPGFDTWAAIQREAIQRQVETTYDRLNQHQLANHDINAAIETAARWVARAPLSEAAYRRLITAQALAGDRAGALRTYEQCRAILEREYGIEPARETSILSEQISRDEISGGTVPSLRRHGADSRTSSLAGYRPTPLPLTGRAEEHSILATAFRRTREEGTIAVAVIGAAGVGKTRLVNAFQEWVKLDSPGVEVWDGRAFEMGGRLPYQPIVEAMRSRLEQENAPEDLLDDVWLAELSQLMPELRARYPDLPPPMTGDANFVRSRLFAAMATLGIALADRHPAVFLLDDMQWVDADTRDMVHYLARRWAESGAPILLLLTVRQENFAADTSLREWLVQLGRDVPLTRLLLDTLNGNDVRQLTTQLANTDADEEDAEAFGDWLWAETQGLPFFIEAMLQMLVGEGILPITKTTGGPPRYDFAAAMPHVKSAGKVQVPQGVREAILSQLNRLSQNEADLLMAASVLGRECSFERLSQVANVSELDTLHAIEVLLNSRLMTESSMTQRPYMLAHDYIREVVYRDSHEVRRRIFHRRALIALEADRAPAAECAFHALASLLDEPAFRFSLAAGDDAIRANAFQESLAHYGRAIEVAQRMRFETEKIPSISILQLYQNRGRALEQVYDFRAAQANYEEMAKLSEKRNDLSMRLASILAQCIIFSTYTPVFDPHKAKELGEAALELVAKVNDREAEARALWCLMLVEFHTIGDSQKVFAYGEKALVMARELGLKELEGYVLGNLAWAYSNQAQLSKARQANKEALDIWLEMGNLPMAADAYTFKISNQLFGGEYEAVLATAKEALRLNQSIGNIINHCMALIFVGEIHRLQGRFGQALVHFEKAEAILEETGNNRSLQGVYVYEALTYLVGGAFERAEQLADQIYAGREEFIPMFQQFFIATIAWTKISLGKLREAEAVLEQANPIPDWGAPFSVHALPLFVVQERLKLAQGNTAGLLDRITEMIRQMKQAGMRYYLAEMLWLQGKACLALEERAQAKAALSEAKAVAEDTGERTILWQILITLSELEEVSGNAFEAEELRRQAQDLICYIAENAGSTDLRDSFLAQPSVAQSSSIS